MTLLIILIVGLISTIYSNTHAMNKKGLVTRETSTLPGNTQTILHQIYCSDENEYIETDISKTKQNKGNTKKSKVTTVYSGTNTHMNWNEKTEKFESGIIEQIIGDDALSKYQELKSEFKKQY